MNRQTTAIERYFFPESPTLSRRSCAIGFLLRGDQETQVPPSYTPRPSPSDVWQEDIETTFSKKDALKRSSSRDWSQITANGIRRIVET